MIHSRLYHRQARRKLALQAFGSQCGMCTYSCCPKILEFHHIDPRTKDKTVSTKIRGGISWKRVVAELRKCVLLCPTCHAEIHAKFSKLPANIQRFDESYATYAAKTRGSGLKTIGK